jgi:hypothetical protein
MKKIKTFDKFLENLFKSIESGKDVYVFGYTLEFDSDFQLLDENEDYDEYYTIFCLDFNRLQELLTITLNCDDEDYIIINDLYNETNEEGETTLVKRMHIFKKI